MIYEKLVLAVIPARGGSKRFPRKNVALFQGKPLIQWAWEAALGSKYIDRVVLSTEDREIAKLAGANHITVVMRPDELASDDALNEDVLRHALTIFAADWVVLLQPTSPLRTKEDIDACIERAQMGHGCITYNRATNEKNGAVYVATTDWISKHDFPVLGLMRLLMDEERSLDIDYKEQIG